MVFLPNSNTMCRQGEIELEVLYHGLSGYIQASRSFNKSPHFTLCLYEVQSVDVLSPQRCECLRLDHRWVVPGLWILLRMSDQESMGYLLQACGPW